MFLPFFALVLGKAETDTKRHAAQPEYPGRDDG